MPSSMVSLSGFSTDINFDSLLKLLVIIKRRRRCIAFPLKEIAAFIVSLWIYVLMNFNSVQEATCVDGNHLSPFLFSASFEGTFFRSSCCTVL